MIEVLDPGPLLTVQDGGRPGYAHLGVPPSGAADARAAARANALVGNAPGAAVLEATLAGPRLRFRESAVVAVSGAVALDARQVGAGEELDLGRYERGARAYVAVRGGIDVDRVLGSRSTDLLSGLGPPAVRTGDVLRVGADVSAEAAVGSYGLPDEVVLRLLPGPRADWVDAAALGTVPWRVSPASNRIGIRLEGPTLSWLRGDELESEGVVTGAIQVPRAGQPILLGPDHPTTGGYPVVAVVHSYDLWVTGQLRPGDRLRFRLTERSTKPD
jgi:biotin-dependent carboxylase-like uncharacterized protein